MQTEKLDPPGISRLLTLLFSIAGGAAVGNLYWAQPLLTDIALTFHVAVGSASILITTTQIGYAIGIVLLVPLGDTLNRRRLIPAIMVCSAVALLACAFAPTFLTLLAALSAVGLTTVAGQILTPLAGDLSRPEERGHVVATVVSGLIMGILLSRTISGFLADALGWRSIYIAAALVTLILAIVLACVLPQERARPRVSYVALLKSIFTVVGQYPSVQITLVIGAAMFAVFSMYWTGLTFLLGLPPYSYSVSQIGLVGLVGLAGALAARRAGRFHDRGRSVGATGAALVLGVLSLLIGGFGSHSIYLILLSVLILDIAVQATNVLNQTRLLSVAPNARSRLNTAFVACNFIGGAIGSAVTGILWEYGRWSAVVSGASVLVVFAIGVWFICRHKLAV